VLGKHTDYAGGRTMVVAIERGLAIVVAPRSDRTVRVVDAISGEQAEFSAGPELTPTIGHWSNYPMTVVRRIARNFPAAVGGATVALASDLPQASGLSSSSALMVAVFLALDAVWNVSAQPSFAQHIASLTDLAGYLGTIENGQTFGDLAGDRGVGTFGGSEDHTAILCAEPDQISEYSYCPVCLRRRLNVPPELTFAVAVSGVVAQKTGAARDKYNRASLAAAGIVELWRRATGRADRHLAEVLDSGPDAAGQLMEVIDREAHDDDVRDALLARLEHFLVENEQVVPTAGDALAVGDWLALGDVVDLSQHSAAQLLGNQVEQTSFLAQSARQRGAVAASAFGAGFGGSVWALVEADLVRSFLAGWHGTYRDHYPAEAAKSTFFATAAGPAAFRVC